MRSSRSDGRGPAHGTQNGRVLYVLALEESRRRTSEGCKFDPRFRGGAWDGAIRGCGVVVGRSAHRRQEASRSLTSPIAFSSALISAPSPGANSRGLTSFTSNGLRQPRGQRLPVACEPGLH
jgi:hypothetical protein